jgi:hypothetical protein
MKFIELEKRYYNIRHIASIDLEYEYKYDYYVHFIFTTDKFPLNIKYDELSPSAKQFVDKVKRINELEDDVDSKYKNLETKCDEILEAIKYLPVVSGDYNNAKTHFETQQV